MEHYLFGIEVKCRTNASTAQREFENDVTAAKYVMLKYDDPDLRQLIPSKHEACQILHHPVVFDLRLVLLLAGNAAGKVIRGVFVEFDDGILQSYKSVLKSIYHLALEPFYQDDIPKEAPKGMERAMKSLHFDCTWDELRHEILLWQVLQYSVTLPIPNVCRIIPGLYALWNRS